MLDIIKLGDQIFRFESGQPGPNVAIIGGVHGNEITGIKVVRSLEMALRDMNLKLRSGTITLALGNLLAIERGQRGSEQGEDLNRCFTDDVLIGGLGNGYKYRRARELAGALRYIDIGIDLHATNKPSEPFIICQRHPTDSDRRILSHFNAQKILTDPFLKFAGQRVALDEYLAGPFGVGLCYETGCANDTSRKQVVESEIINLLVSEGVLRGTANVTLSMPSSHHETYELTEAIICPEHQRGSKNSCWKKYKTRHSHNWAVFGEWYDGHQPFRWAPGFGGYSFQAFQAEQCIAYLNEEPLVPSYTGVIVFPKPSDLIETDKPVGYLARLVK